MATSKKQNLQLLTIRVAPALMKLLDDTVKALQAASPYASVTKTSVARDALVRGLKQIKSKKK